MEPGDPRQQLPQTSKSGPRHWRRAALPAVLIGAGMGLAACGGGSPSASPGPSGGSPSSVVAKALKYSECMRSHGEPDFPDPNSQGGFEFKNSASLNPQSPAFQAAENDCQSVKPSPGNVSAAQENQEFTEVLKAAACIQKNGYPSFPEPTMVNGSIGISFSNSNIDLTSPAFKKVAKKCDAPAGLLP
ncbi:MAG TPA: hypothetical protein VMU95_19040 [Trebonia sp.]|nr:hypothetical protein [Trebonia sp.]